MNDVAEVVDSIVANLELRYQQYEQGMNRVIALNQKLAESYKQTGATQGAAEASLNRSAQKVASEEQATTDKVVRTRRKRATDVAAINQQEVAAVKAAAKAKADAEIAEAERSARLRAVAERAVNRQGVVPGTGSRIGATVPREITGQRPIPAAVLSGAASDEVAVETEVNHLLADQATLRSHLSAATGQAKRDIQDTLAELQLENSLRKAGIADEEIILRLEARQAAVAASRAAAERKQATAGIQRFAEGAGLGRVGGSAAAVGGIALAAGVGITSEIVQNAADYAKELTNVSKQLGLTTDQTQVYEAAARRAGATEEQFRTGLGQLGSYLGRAQSGGVEEAKTFTALGISIKGVASAGELLPSLIDRISSIEDPARRAAIETRLFGEEGRKLDGLLSGGNDQINELAQALISTGAVLSSSDIQRLDGVSKKLAEVKAQLQVDLADVVAGNSDAILALAHSFSVLVTDIKDAINWISAYNSQKLNDLTGGKPLAPQVIVDSQNAWERLAKKGASFVAGQLNSAQPQRDQMTDQARASLARFNAPAVQGGSVNNKLLDKLNAPKPPKGKSADQLANEADERTRRFNDIMGRLHDEQQRSVADQTQNEYERSDIEKRQIERDRDREVADLKLKAQQDIRKGADAKLTNARLAQATAATEAAAAEKLNVISLRDTLEGLNRTSAARQRSYDLQAAMLQDAEGLAKTQAERRRIADQQRDLDRKRETDSANLVLERADQGDPSVSTTELEGARSTLRTQNQRFAGRKLNDDKQTAGPIESYLSNVPRDVDQINERFQQAAVDGVGRLNDSLADTATKFLHLHGLAGQFIADIIRIGIERETASLIFGDGKGGKSGISSLLGSIGGLFGHRASGGNVVGGGSYLVGENGPEVVSLGSSGRVYPNGALPAIAAAGRGPGGLVQHITIDARNSVVPTEFAGQILQAADVRSRQHAAAAGQAAVEAAPSRVNRVSVLGG